MEKQILTIGYTIPAFDKNHVGFHGSSSLMDADILLISPNALYPMGEWVSFTSSDGGCYNVEASRAYKQKMSRLKKEINDHLNAGKNVFIFLTKEDGHCLANGVSMEKKSRNFNTETYSNYNFLPINIGTLTSASGKHIEFSGNPIFSDFYKKFKNNLEYQLYIENPNKAQAIFTGKDKTKILGATYKEKNGHIVALPFLGYNENKFTEYRGKEKKSYWTSEAIKFGHSLTSCLVNIDQQLTQESEKTPTPEWATQKDFSIKKALLIEKEIEKNEQKIEELKVRNIQLSKELVEENILKDLLFEQSKPLENAVITALGILGYQAENYDDGVLELDQVITSPEKHRFIGECEGKDSKDINITKFRQLLESLNADFERDEVKEKAFGILFGNPQRLTNPNERNLDFTQKCKIGAEREKIALIKTADLFIVSQYLNENKNEEYKKTCRKTIYDGLGKVVEFPKIPKK